MFAVLYEFSTIDAANSLDSSFHYLKFVLKNARNSVGNQIVCHVRIIC